MNAVRSAVNGISIAKNNMKQSIQWNEKKERLDKKQEQSFRETETKRCK